MRIGFSQINFSNNTTINNGRTAVSFTPKIKPQLKADTVSFGSKTEKESKEEGPDYTPEELIEAKIGFIKDTEDYSGTFFIRDGKKKNQLVLTALDGDAFLSDKEHEIDSISLQNKINKVIEECLDSKALCEDLSGSSHDIHNMRNPLIKTDQDIDKFLNTVMDNSFKSLDEFNPDMYLMPVDDELEGPEDDDEEKDELLESLTKGGLLDGMEPDKTENKEGRLFRNKNDYVKISNDGKEDMYEKGMEVEYDYDDDDVEDETFVTPTKENYVDKIDTRPKYGAKVIIQLPKGTTEVDKQNIKQALNRQELIDVKEDVINWLKDERTALIEDKNDRHREIGAN